MEDATAARERRDYVTALRLLRPLADKGIPEAQRGLAAMYCEGEGISEDFQECAKWYRLAAEQGDEDAKLLLGWEYLHKKTPVNPQEADKLFESMDADHQAQVANMLLANRTPADLRAAAKWRKRAAERGNTEAQSSLGTNFYDGDGVPRDFEQAAYWLRQAADEGDPDGQRYLGGMYEKGDGVIKDFVTAYMWFNLATAGYSRLSSTFLNEMMRQWAIKTRDYTAQSRDELAKRMTASQIAEAQRLAREWRPTSSPTTTDAK